LFNDRHCSVSKPEPDVNVAFVGGGRTSQIDVIGTSRNFSARAYLSKLNAHDIAPDFFSKKISDVGVVDAIGRIAGITPERKFGRC
jgi:hypothetical protein